MQKCKLDSLWRGFVVSCYLLAISIPVHAGDILYVDDDATPGGDGRSWDTAFRFLQDAFATARQTGFDIEEFRIAQGVYRPDEDSLHPEGSGDRNLSFTLVDGVRLRGGYRGLSSTSPDDRNVLTYKTVISGDLNLDDAEDYEFNDENSYHVIVGLELDRIVVLDGIVIRGGNADHDEFSNEQVGGGIWVAAVDLVLIDCTIAENSAMEKGGGLYGVSSSLLFEDCRIRGNRTETSGDFTFGGGGIYTESSRFYEHSSAIELRRCDFRENVTRINGGAMHCRHDGDVVLQECSFTNNHANANGGAVTRFKGVLNARDCTFESNSAGFSGGAILSVLVHLSRCSFLGNQTNGTDAFRLSGGAVKLQSNGSIIDGCIFRNNSSLRGGAISASNSLPLERVTELRNCLLVDNAATIRGGAIEFLATQCEIRNCTIASNIAPNSGAIFQVGVFADSKLFNSVLWNNGSDPIVNQSSLSFTSLFSCIIEGGWGGDGDHNLDIDPRFLDPDGPDDDPATYEDNDYRLSADSPAIDSGSNSFLPDDLEFDLEGRPRILDGNSDGVSTVDIGAYEFDPPCPSDLNGDGIVDVLDLLRVVFALGSQGVVPEDLDGDGVVTFGDMLIIIRNFGPCPVITSGCPADLDNNDMVNVHDLLMLLSALGTCPDPQDSCPPDLDHDGDVDVTDLLALLAAWGACP